MIFNPHDYQTVAEKWIMDHPQCALFLDMGLGKTVITLSAVKKLLDAGQVRKVLVVAPLRVAQTVWAEEAAKWDHLSTLRFVKILGSAQKRKEALHAPGDIYVINRENVQWLVNELAAMGHKWPWDMLILDELSSFKSGRTSRFTALKRVRECCGHIVGLTGTPAPNSLMDLWSEMYLIDGGERLGRFISHYREAYFVAVSVGMMYTDYRLRRNADKKIYDKIRDIVISMSALDHLIMPELRLITVPVEIPDVSRKAYEQMKKHRVLEFKKELDKKRECIMASSAGVLALELLQLANGAIYTDGVDYTNIHSAKIEALQELIEEAQGKPMLVFYSFKHDLKRLKQAIPGARVLYTAQDVEDWNAGQVPVMLAHPAAAGHGLNLQAGGNIVVWFGLTWSLELYQQANARLYRQGQENGVTVYHLVAKDTIDERVMSVLAGKEQQQQMLIDAVRAEVAKYGRWR